MQPPALPELNEPEVVRHYVNLSHLNFAVDTGFYPLGSCTMKFNPKLNEWAARLRGFAELHPMVPDQVAQGTLQLLHDLESALAEISGMRAVTLQPAAGAQGELTGILMIRAYHRSRGDFDRMDVLVPDSSHGTNPATASMAGFRTITIPSAADGGVDTQLLFDLATANPNLETLPFRPELSIVPIRAVPPGVSDLNAFNTQLCTAIQSDGRVYLSLATIDGDVWLRPCFTNFRTTTDDVLETLAVIDEMIERIR